MKVTTYEWSWRCLSLFRNYYDPELSGGGSSRLFTLKPAWVWFYWKNEFMVAIGKWPPDPFYICELWLRRNNHFHKEGPAFMQALSCYAASCEPGTYVAINPRFLK